MRGITNSRIYLHKCVAERIFPYNGKQDDNTVKKFNDTLTTL